MRISRQHEQLLLQRRSGLGRGGTKAPLAWTSHCIVSFSAGLAKYSDGMADSDMAINLQPAYPMGYMRKAEFLMLKEDYEGATDVFKLGIKMCETQA